MSKKMHTAKRGSSTSDMDLMDQKMDIKSILKDIEFLGSSHMTWKERKELENRKVVSLGGKPSKKQRLPLSVARVMMKKQKEREQKNLHESSILGHFGGNFGGGNKKVADKRKAEDRVLKSTEGRFRNGVLDVKHLLKPVASSDTVKDTPTVDKWNKRKGGKKNQGKKKGGGKKRH
ncbi:uncharacterized protein LOC132311527 [Cornus florida]|uniref:uncharacterized protein LOC132311527 n=1 Tax=Cornus florida TaxID=4283 RepID=UPI0028969845|nr:uncharacterized protein LOC132311527 [Cornus florida]XP_059665430.1 uncharacterized protein LOC132311527 [Cornus florida]XP_059665431.1 uncharacterized protein LOC132311527 [Cornus florida]XP_059665432.1 uncharacterized protein LOC132311527 [Cornus florida]XP_059665433.1 uncharacterized protein LOC132311527 [Cornus florida]